MPELMRRHPSHPGGLTGFVWSRSSFNCGQALVVSAIADSIRVRAASIAVANHVPVQVLTGSDNLVPALAELAGSLGLQ